MVTIGITPDGNTRRPRPTYSLDLTSRQELHWACTGFAQTRDYVWPTVVIVVEHPEHFKNSKADAGSWAESWELKWGLSGDPCTRVQYG